ncbi:hypothetical protein OK074_4992 [Actinobacteria bacterium OK074]|nr:hypothetical protein OK074_4992 [Actinobacteria bacterium OK074]
MTAPPDEVLFEVPAPPSTVERLLDLAAHFTQHNDTLDIVLGRADQPASDAHAASARRLASATGAAVKAIHGEQLYESPELSDALVRLGQLAYLSAASADHGPRPARALTALAPEAVVDCAAQVAAEIRRRRWNTSAPPDQRLTDAQCTALKEIARGHIVVTGSLGRQYVHSRQTRVLISTLRSLESHNLADRRPRSASPAHLGGPPQDRVLLTPAGTRAVASILPLSPATEAEPAPAARPAASAQAVHRNR